MSLKITRGRRLVIPDIHGCYNTLIKLLSNVHVNKEDKIYFLGDYVNRGTKNKEVIDYLLNLKHQGYKLFLVRGNHEQMLLGADSQFHNSRFILPGIRKPPDLYDNNNRLFCKYSDFFNELPFYYELDSFFIVHAGFNTKIDDPFKDTSSMMWIDNFDYDPVKLKGKRVIHGHTSASMDQILSSISNKSMVIPLDNGINETNSDTKGNLLCLDIDKMEIIIQKNIEKES